MCLTGSPGPPPADVASSRPYFKGAVVRKDLPKRGLVQGEEMKAWLLDESIFGSRRLMCDSRSYFDSKVRFATPTGGSPKE